MDEIGNLLREAREARGLTLLEASNSTRISLKYLEALENGQYELLPTTVHIRGYLRNYARYLDLDPDPLLERYELNKDGRPKYSQSDQEEALSDEPLQPREDQPFFNPVNVDMQSGERRATGSIQRWIIIVALIIALALIANRFIPMFQGNGDGTEALTEGIQEAVSNITGEDPFATPTINPTLLPGAGDVITSTARNDAISLPTATPTRPTLPATLETIRMRLDITQRAWMRVTIDDEVVFEGLVRRGDEPYEWEAEQSAQLLTGNGAGIFVTINDVELGRLGSRGEVVEETWSSTGTE
jgi:transcriptional regulator with XRE-family HTH domain